MIGILVAAGGVRRQVIAGMARAVTIDVVQASLSAVDPGQPTQEVVEGPVLHHDHDDVVDA